jgi:hypothetical protein
MGLRPTHGDESANVRCRRINGLWRAFNRAVIYIVKTFPVTVLLKYRGFVV